MKGKFVCIGGRPGSGKTTLSQKIQQITNAKVISRDNVFRKLFKKPNPHSTEHKSLAFKECLRLVKLSSRQKEYLVILDMPFSRNDEIIGAYHLAKEIDAKWIFIYLKCPEYIARLRILKQKDHLVIPQRRINTRTEPLPKSVNIRILDSSKNIETYLGKVLKHITT